MGLAATLTRSLLFGVFAASLGWIMFAATLEEADTSLNVGGALVRSRRLMRSPAPKVKPRAPLPYRDYVGDKYNLRACQCLQNWAALEAEKPGGTVGLCRCRGNCAPSVTPEWLTEAAGQALCSLEYQTGYKCSAVCDNERSPVKWFASPCGGPGQDECDKPLFAERKARREGKPWPPPEEQEQEEEEEEEQPQEEEKKEEPPAPAEEEKKAPAEEVPAPAPAPAPEAPAAPAPPAKAAAPADGLAYDPREVYDLRGLQCEEKDGKEQCFYEDAQGRELCPPHVTAEWLAFPKDQYLCSADMAKQYYCTAGCQEGNPEVRWGAHEIAWCSAPANKGSCPERATPIPKADFRLKPWSANPEPVKPCAAAAARGEKPPGVVKDLTVGLLTHEPISMRDTLATYEAGGLFDVVSEFLIYVNKRRPEIDAELEKYVKKYPGKLRVMGDANNYGILRGMVYLTGNASNPYFLFLERDFQLVEPATCIYEQLTAGVEMVKAKTAHVVRYRHRKKAGRPNWAERMFRGKEEEVFHRGQPNLFCNHYYWVPDPDKRWPDKMWICKNEPQMYCSDSFYCNWTNNPQLWAIDWWNKEYVSKFDSFKHNDPWYDIEFHMNWEPNAWNDRKWIVAQGDGLFKHVDRGNYGIF